jgi:hypothetical protein
MSNNLKIGKKSKVISRDIYDFSLDSLRKIISSQNLNLDNSLDQGIRITDVNEQLNPQSLTINGYLYINAKEQILNNLINSFINVKDNTYNYLNFSYNKHFEEKLDPDLPSNSELARINKLIFGVDFEYNKFIKKYENFLLNNEKLPEINLPNFYDTIDELIVTNNDLLKKSDFLEKPEDIISTNTLDTDFETIINSSNLRTSTGNPGTFLKFDEYLKKYNFLSNQFPFNVRIKISKDIREDINFSSKIHDYNLYFNFFSYIINNSVSTKIIQKDINDAVRENNIKECILGEQFKNTFNASLGSLTNFFTQLQATTLQKVNNFSDILSGKEDYAEVIGYKIEKYESKGNNLPRLIQQYYLPNVSDQTIEYIDTQIFANKNYKYKIKLLVLTYKYNYKYTNITKNNGYAKLEYNYSPFGVIYELDSSEFTDSISNHKLPPIDPDIEFIPYIGIDNKVKINITPGNGEKIAKIEFINSEEASSIPNLALMQMLSMIPVGSDKLKYASSLPIKSYEIYRTTEKPTSYLDFSSHLIKTIDLSDSYAVSFEDNINSNKKYYYTFRSIDYQGSYSLPTHIYEFEIINDNGTIIPNVSIVNLNNTSNMKIDSKQMRTFLKIQPAIAQKVLQSISNNGVKLGINKESVWGKDFKIRIKSKQTGKILDFNIKFTYNS